MIKDIEEIIRTKSYFELSKEELEAVSEFAQNNRGGVCQHAMVFEWNNFGGGYR